jgi:hypothetical protein
MFSFSHTALKGMALNLEGRGVPAFFAMQVAGACYPSGARKEHRKSGFPFAKPLINPTAAMLLTDEALRASQPIPDQHSIAWLYQIFGSEQVLKWADEIERKAKGEESRLATVKKQRDIDNAFDLLGLATTAGRSEVAARYRDLCLECHPDRTGHLPEQVQAERGQRLKKIHDAYALLIEHLPEKLAFPDPPPSTPGHHGGGLTTHSPPPAGDGSAIDKLPNDGEPPGAVGHLKDGWFVYAAFVLGLCVCAVVASVAMKANNSTENPPQSVSVDGQSPLPLSDAEQRLEAAVASARSRLERRDYEGALHALRVPTPDMFSPQRPASISDLTLWSAFLSAYQEACSGQFRAIGFPDEADKHQYWPHMHRVALAWHYHMRDAIAQNRREEASRAYTSAEDLYGDIFAAVTPQRQEEAKFKWRHTMLAFAMENGAVVKKQMAAYTGDKELLMKAKRCFEECRDYDAARNVKKDSRFYIKACEELEAISGLLMTSDDK